MSTRKRTFTPDEPTEAMLRKVALHHLARYSATKARLLRVLERRIDRWLAACLEGTEDAAPRAAARRVVANLEVNGIVDDAAYAAGRARLLLRSGKSSRQIMIHLAQRGIGPATVRACVPEDPEQELAAALLLARRRRVGPFGDWGTDATTRRRALSMFARAGFSQSTALIALATPLPEAEARIEAMRRG